VDPSVSAREGLACVVYEDEAGLRQARVKRLTTGRYTVQLASANPEYGTVEVPRAKVLAAWPIMRHLVRAVGEGD